MRWCALISLLLACGGGEGQQCEIFSDCPSGQVCLMNVCTDLDAGTDAAEDGAIPTTCGNGMLDPGEECDQGAANADEADTCRLNCSFPTCGDSIVDRGEGCDDGNDQIFDTCTPQCRVESAECVVVHSGDERGSTFTTVTLSGGLPGVVRGLSTTHAHTNEVEHSLVRCGARLFAATDGGILALGLRNGAPIAGALEPSGDVRELACSDGELFAVDPRSLSRYSVTETGLSLIDTVELPFEMRNQTRVIPFARAGGIMLIAISARGAGRRRPVHRVGRRAHAHRNVPTGRLRSR